MTVSVYANSGVSSATINYDAGNSSVDERYPFPLAGKEFRTPQELDNLLRRLILSKYDKMMRAKDAYHKEIAGDSFTFWATLQQPLNPVNWALSIMALDVIRHFKKKYDRKKTTVHKLLNIWDDTHDKLRDNSVSNQDVFKKTEAELKKFGIDFEDADDFDLATFDEQKYRELHRLYNSTAFKRAQATLKQPFKETVYNLPKNTVRTLKDSFNFVRGFFVSVAHDFKDPRSMRTIKDIRKAAESWTKIVALRAKNIRDGFDPDVKEIRKLRKEYRKSPAIIQKWEDAIVNEDSIDERTRLARDTARPFVTSQAFLLGNLFNALSIGVIQAIQQDFDISPYVPYVLGSIVAVGPVRNIARELTHHYNLLSSVLATGTHHFLQTHQDKNVIRQAENIQTGFRELEKLELQTR